MSILISPTLNPVLNFYNIIVNITCSISSPLRNTTIEYYGPISHVEFLWYIVMNQ